VFVCWSRSRSAKQKITQSASVSECAYYQEFFSLVCVPRELFGGSNNQTEILDLLACVSDAKNALFQLPTGMVY